MKKRMYLMALFTITTGCILLGTFRNLGPGRSRDRFGRVGEERIEAFGNPDRGFDDGHGYGDRGRWDDDDDRWDDFEDWFDDRDDRWDDFEDRFNDHNGRRDDFEDRFDDDDDDDKGTEKNRPSRPMPRGRNRSGRNTQ